MNSTFSSNPAVVIGIDLAKSHCDVVGYDKDRKMVLKRPRIAHRKLLEMLSNMPRAVVLMEACGGSHCFVRKVQALGHDGRLLNPGDWVRKIKASGKKYGVKVCAIAAKLARIAWRILREKDAAYRPQATVSAGTAA
ncbi:hypothetical protein MAF45_07070 [Mesosutterella sp. OilRF-GAM-744-9]|uniref:IS110 family transposase n=1 Tax=Mesosutterella porci TaxID=2915351 RepID=A0ABS9MRE1_9BURK|nr:hypothetical protein [Mesosutterella sp. oilRF-744-WT-GAM-9]MCG5031203.1 hypothetical protein [Mesosutterella sp. oilRF-744-WT-GAM-9]